MGLDMVGKVSVGDNRYRYNGIERNDELGLDLAFYRSYDPAIGRWMQIDPKPTHSQSPYSGIGNNPILYSDMLGDTIDVFGPDGSFLYHYDDGKEKISGHYFQNCEDCSGEGEASYSGGIGFEYNDIENDRPLALFGMYSFEVISDEWINSEVSKSLEGVSPSLIDAYSAGRKGGSIDFWGRDDTPISGNTMYITNSARGGSAAYNPNDFGNYLTGQALRRLGFSLGQTQGGAHINNMLHPGDYGSRQSSGWLDSPGDQRAIANGYHHFSKKQSFWWQGMFIF